jgi:tetratricopeptide (TPR) repeat protein
MLQQLGDRDFSVREEATRRIWTIGDPALAVLSENRHHPNPEARRRIDILLTCIKWRMSPALFEKLAGVMSGYEEKDWQTRQTICIDLGVVGKEKVIPTLLQIFRHDPSPSVKRTAVATLYKMGDVGIAALIGAGINIDGLDPYYVDIFISLGNRYLTEGKYDKAETEYRKALRIAPRNSVAAYNMACAYSLKKDLDNALDWLEKCVQYGFDDFKWMREDPDLKNLHEMPRFKEILRRRGKPSSEAPPPEFPPDIFDFGE